MFIFQRVNYVLLFICYMIKENRKFMIFITLIFYIKTCEIKQML